MGESASDRRGEGTLTSGLSGEGGVHLGGQREVQGTKSKAFCKSQSAVRNKKGRHSNMAMASKVIIGPGFFKQKLYMLQEEKKRKKKLYLKKETYQTCQPNTKY